jgi:cytochrome c5
VVPVILISMIASLATRSVTPGPGATSDEAVAKRLKPIGEVVVAEGSDQPGQRSGKEIVESICAACHTTGALNAPKIGDTAAWAPLIKQGLQQLTEIAIKGIRQMPPRGGNPELTDIEVARAVAYLANQSGAKFAEPAAPKEAPAQTAAAATPAAPTAATAAKPGAAPAASGSADSGAGKSTYDKACTVCHTAGVAGAPKTGDKAAWAPRLKQGANALYEAALKGKGAMPPKGGNTALPDADVKAAVDYMVGLVK